MYIEFGVLFVWFVNWEGNFGNKITQEKGISKQCCRGLFCLNTDVTPAALSGNCYCFSFVTFPFLAVAKKPGSFSPIWGHCYLFPSPNNPLQSHLSHTEFYLWCRCSPCCSWGHPTNPVLSKSCIVKAALFVLWILDNIWKASCGVWLPLFGKAATNLWGSPLQGVVSLFFLLALLWQGDNDGIFP